jgi:hypothetical protein
MVHQYHKGFQAIAKLTLIAVGLGAVGLSLRGRMPNLNIKRSIFPFEHQVLLGKRFVPFEYGIKWKNILIYWAFYPSVYLQVLFPFYSFFFFEIGCLGEEISLLGFLVEKIGLPCSPFNLDISSFSFWTSCLNPSSCVCWFSITFNNRVTASLEAVSGIESAMI